MGRRFLTTAIVAALGVAIGIAVAQVGSAVAVPPQRAQNTSLTDAPALDEYIPQGAFVRVADEAQRSLVFIQTEQMVTRGLIDGFRRFFGEESVPDEPDERLQQSSGSGFLVSASGHIVTNAHVVSQTDFDAREVKVAETVRVRLVSDEEFDAEVVGVDIGTDLAVLKINAGHDLPFLPRGDSDQARVGEWVMALGAPFGLTNTVSAGIISAKGRAQVGPPDSNQSTYKDFIQTDAAINTGNSGGPLVNLRGEVIGINTMIVSNGFQAQFAGVGFAIPMNLVSSVVDQLIEHGRTIRGWLGISMVPLDANVAGAYGLDRGEMRGAVEIATVNPGEPAEMAGVKEGDIVVATDGVQLDGNQDFLQRVAITPPDGDLTLDIVRVSPDDTDTGFAHEARSISVMLGERPPEVDVLADQNARTQLTELRARRGLAEREMSEIEERFGMYLADLDRNIASDLEYRLEDGGIVVLGVLRDRPAPLAGLLPGSIIRHVNWRPVDSIEGFAGLVNRFEAGETAVLDIRLPDDRTIRYAIEIPR